MMNQLKLVEHKLDHPVALTIPTRAEAEKVKSLVRERGTFKVIDRVTVKLNEKKDIPKELPADLKRVGPNQVPGTVSEKASKGGKKFTIRN